MCSIHFVSSIKIFGDSFCSKTCFEYVVSQQYTCNKLSE